MPSHTLFRDNLRQFGKHCKVGRVESVDPLNVIRLYSCHNLQIEDSGAAAYTRILASITLGSTCIGVDVPAMQATLHAEIPGRRKNGAFLRYGV